MNSSTSRKRSSFLWVFCTQFCSYRIAFLMVLLSSIALVGLRCTKGVVMWGNRLHIKCRGGVYPRSDVKRFHIPDDKVKWSVPWPEYEPTNYTSPSVMGRPWADLDLEDDQFSIKFNEESDGQHRSENVVKDRKSYMGVYEVVNKYPLNPVGRTGIKGRGVLGKWGPNHAADPILTRWLRDGNGKKILNQDTRLPILEFVGIMRRHGGEWAIPGGMVDAGEDPDHTAQREFLEETMNSEKKNAEELAKLTQLTADIFSKGQRIYCGYVDDPRNTDNAWMETFAVNFHAEGNEVDHWPFEAGSDAKAVSWLEISSKLNLYASHFDLIRLVAERHKAHWSLDDDKDSSRGKTDEKDSSSFN